MPWKTQVLGNRVGVALKNTNCMSWLVGGGVVVVVVVQRKRLSSEPSRFGGLGFRDRAVGMS